MKMDVKKLAYIPQIYNTNLIKTIINNNNDKKIQFQNNDNNNNELIALASYPRSGNTLLRILIEHLTHIKTGSDNRIDRTLVKQLIAMGLNCEKYNW